LTGDRAADQFFGVAAGIAFRCVDQRHAERNASAQRFLFNRRWVPSFPKMPRALAKCCDDGAVGEFDCATAAVWHRGESRCTC